MRRRSSLTLRIDEAEMLVETVVVLMKWHTIFATESALENLVVLELASTPLPLWPQTYEAFCLQF